MKQPLLTLLLVGVIGFSTNVVADVVQDQEKVILSIDSARCIADAEFKKITNNSVTRFSVQLVWNRKEEIVFVYEDLDVPPRPGSEIYITIDKETLKVSWEHGR